MKLPVTPRSALLLIFYGILPVSAQMIEVPAANLTISGNKFESLGSTENPSFASDQSLSGVFQLPTVHKTSSELSESNPVYLSQNASTLTPRRSAIRTTDNILDLSALREPSPYRNATRVKLKVSDAQANGIQAGLAEISAAYKMPGQKADSADCLSVGLSVGHRVQVDPSNVLEVVESEISANPSCACEIVKSAIKMSGADIQMVADITEVAITSAPYRMRMISQCAIATMPDALPAVQAVLAKLDPNSGDSSYSAKDSKSGKDAKAAIASAVKPPTAPPNPLDTPRTNGGPPPGTPPGSPPGNPPVVPPPFFPPPTITNPNP